MSKIGWALFFAALAYAVRVFFLLGFTTELIFDDQSCRIVGDEMHGSEDLTVYRDGLVFVTSGDLHNAFYRDEAHPGAIFLLDLTRDTPFVHKLEIDALPTAYRFQPHGFFYSNSTSRLLVVSHGLEAGGGTRIFRFEVVHAASAAGYPKLKFLTTLKSGEFFSGSLNDVIEGWGESELYVTLWLQRPLPKKGKAHPEGSEKLDLLLQTGLQIFYPGTNVLRCTFDEKARGLETAAKCVEVATGFFGANGITTDAKKQNIFVADATGRTVTNFTRGSDGKLDQASVLRFETCVDNIEYDFGSEKVTVGGIPIAWKALKKMQGGHMDVPGAILEFSAISDGSEMRTLVTHDGGKLSQISAGIRSRGKVLLGSPFSRGVLVCDE